MAAEDQRRRRPRLPLADAGADADRISDLPDDLLHRIQICLPSTADAARTSVLSRRWRRVWTRLPELALRFRSPDPERVDAALAAWSAPVLRRLEITLPGIDRRHVTAGHVSSWLRFAAQRLAGELRLSLPCYMQEVAVPVNGRFTAISVAPLRLPGAWVTGLSVRVRLRFQLLSADGVFTALAALRIKYASMESRELEQVVSSSRCCPRLKELVLEDIFLVSNDSKHDDDVDVFSIRSDSLEKLRVANVVLCSNDDGRLQVATPELQELSLCLSSWGGQVVVGAHVAAPKLSKVCWSRSYDPSRHQLVDAGRRLKRLELTSRSSLALLGSFDAIDELHLDIFVAEGAEDYRTILEDTSKVRCEVLVVTFLDMSHSFEPIMLHLLWKCVGIRKLVVAFDIVTCHPCRWLSCLCHLEHNHLITNGILLDSLQEVVVERAEDTDQIMGLVDVLCRCRETFQRKLHITIPEGNSLSVHRRIDRRRLLGAPNNKVEVTIR